MIMSLIFLRYLDPKYLLHDAVFLAKQSFKFGCSMHINLNLLIYHLTRWTDTHIQIHTLIIPA